MFSSVRLRWRAVASGDTGRPPIAPLGARAMTRPSASVRSRRRRATARAMGALVVRLVADPGCWSSLRTGISRALHASNEHTKIVAERAAPTNSELLKQHALDRPQSAEQRDQKRNWQDRRHFARPIWRQANACSHLSSVTRTASFGSRQKPSRNKICERAPREGASRASLASNRGAEAGHAVGLQTRLAYTGVNKERCWEDSLRAAAVLTRSRGNHENHQRAHERQGL